jgi:hypothetical protein
MERFTTITAVLVPPVNAVTFVAVPDHTRVSGIPVEGMMGIPSYVITLKPPAMVGLVDELLLRLKRSVDEPPTLQVGVDHLVGRVALDRVDDLVELAEPQPVADVGGRVRHDLAADGVDQRQQPVDLLGVGVEVADHQAVLEGGIDVVDPVADLQRQGIGVGATDRLHAPRHLQTRRQRPVGEGHLGVRPGILGGIGRVGQPLTVGRAHGAAVDVRGRTRTGPAVERALHAQVAQRQGLHHAVDQLLDENRSRRADRQRALHFLSLRAGCTGPRGTEVHRSTPMWVGAGGPPAGRVGTTGSADR